MTYAHYFLVQQAQVAPPSLTCALFVTGFVMALAWVVGREA